MLNIEPLRSDTIDEIVSRVMAQQRLVAQRHPLIDAKVDDVLLAETLMSATRDVLVATRSGAVVGHIRGTILDGELFGRSVWINPEGLSYDDELILEHLFVALVDHSLEENANRHFVWVPDDEQSVGPWLRLGFSLMHQRGSLRLSDVTSHPMPEGYTIRRGSIDDLEIAIDLDDHLHEAQEMGPSYAIDLSKSEQRNDWIETLEDPTVFHLVVERDGAPVAQCATYPVPERIGSFVDTIHLSAVTVREEHRRLGIAQAMVDTVLIEARSRGFEFAETNWRITNRRAARYWTTYGFEPTYVRLQRNVGIG